MLRVPAQRIRGKARGPWIRYGDEPHLPPGRDALYDHRMVLDGPPLRPEIECKRGSRRFEAETRARGPRNAVAGRYAGRRPIPRPSAVFPSNGDSTTHVILDAHASKPPAGTAHCTRRFHRTASVTWDFHPFAGTNRRFRTTWVARRERRYPTQVCATCARNGLADSCLGHGDPCAQLSRVFWQVGVPKLPRLFRQRKCSRWM